MWLPPTNADPLHVPTPYESTVTVMDLPATFEATTDGSTTFTAAAARLVKERNATSRPATTSRRKIGAMVARAFISFLRHERPFQVISYGRGAGCDKRHILRRRPRRP